MSPDAIGLVFVLALICAALSVVLYAPLPRTLMAVLCAGLALRVGGALARYGVLYGLYGGSGDAVTYYERGLEYAERFRALDFSPFWDSSLWLHDTWWGTQFIAYPSGLVLSLVGPTMLGEFIVFSLFAFVGLICFFVAFHRALPNVSVTRYAAWLLLFPSLWFWPSSVGKEAIVLLGIGLATLGFVGKHGRISILPLLAGAALLFSIRPQIAAVFIVCAVLAQTLTRRSQWSRRRTLQAGIVVVIGLTTVWYAGRELGIGSFDAEGLQEYVEGDAARRLGGGSSIDAASAGFSGIPIALLNVLTRPFPWEARNFMMLISAAEIAGLWFIIWLYRRNVISAIRNWRSNRLVALTLSFIVLYSIGLGMMMSNLAIIARQRIFLFPFIFILLEAVPARHRALANPRPPRRVLSRREILMSGGVRS